MLTEHEFAVIVMLIERAPRNVAETIAAQAIIEKLKPKPPADVP